MIYSKYEEFYKLRINILVDGEHHHHIFPLTTFRMMKEEIKKYQHTERMRRYAMTSKEYAWFLLKWKE